MNRYGFPRATLLDVAKRWRWRESKIEYRRREESDRFWVKGNAVLSRVNRMWTVSSNFCSVAKALRSLTKTYDTIRLAIPFRTYLSFSLRFIFSYRVSSSESAHCRTKRACFNNRDRTNTKNRSLYAYGIPNDERIFSPFSRSTWRR